jgi:hypothetical protein
MKMMPQFTQLAMYVFQHTYYVFSKHKAARTRVEAVEDVAADVRHVLVEGVQHHLPAAQVALPPVQQQQPHQEAELTKRKVGSLRQCTKAANNGGCAV